MKKSVLIKTENSFCIESWTDVENFWEKENFNFLPIGIIMKRLNENEEKKFSRNHTYGNAFYKIHFPSIGEFGVLGDKEFKTIK